MKAEPEDRLSSNSGRRGFTARHVVAIVIIIAIGLLLWTTRVEHPAPEPPPPVEAVEEIVAPLPPAPDIPPRPEPPPPVEAVEEIVEPLPPPLPPLEESDPLMREEMSAAGVGPALEPLARSQNLVQLGVALVDGFSRGLVPRKLLPLDPPEEDFPVEQLGDTVVMSPRGYQRYDGYASAIADLDTAALVNNFHTLRPLYEQAYALLGLPGADMDNAVIRMLDQVLATPEIEQPIELTRKSVMYRYADPALERLSPVQKQLLRMGPENIRRIKAQARSLREGLLSEQ